VVHGFTKAQQSHDIESSSNCRRTQRQLLDPSGIMVSGTVLLETATRYLNALSTIDGDGIAAVTCESFYSALGPSSMGLLPPNGVSVTRSALVERYHGLKALMSSMNVKIEKEWPPNEAANQVTIWTTASADFLPQIVGDDDISEWSFKPETLFIFTMNETGDKIEHVFEFQDSVAMQNMGPVMAKAMERLGQATPSKTV
jgi:hypothetical protein